MQLSDTFKIARQIKGTSTRATKRQLVELLDDSALQFLSQNYQLNAIGPETLSAISTQSGADVSMESLMFYLDRASETQGRLAKEQVLSELVLDPTYKQFVIDAILGKLALGISFKPANPKLGMPFYPQLCSKDRFDPKHLIVEEKLDGIRVVAHRTEDSVLLFSRNLKKIKSELVERECMKLAPGTIVDGEIVGNESNDMQSLSGRRNAAQYVVFDCLMYEDAYIYKEPLSLRRSRIPDWMNRPTQYDFKTYEEIERFLESEPIEGVVAKDPRSSYLPGERKWSKLKLIKEMTVRVTGWKEGYGRLEGTLGSVEVEAFNEPVQPTNVGSGFDDHTREVMRKRLESGIPTLIEVKYQNKTVDGVLRFPIFKCFRDDLR